MISARLAAIAALLLGCPATAATVSYTSSTAFAAVAGAVQTESFNGIAEDTSFAAGALDFQGFTIAGYGVQLAGRNYVDVPPLTNFAQYDIDGTALVNGYADATGGFTLTFDRAITAFGADFNRVNNATTNATSIRLGGETLLLPNFETAGFLGFVSDTPFTSVSFVTTGVGDGFALDNVRFVESGVPEPASWVIMLTGFGLVGGLMRRRRPEAVPA